jgi:hypothetical protein
LPSDRFSSAANRARQPSSHFSISAWRLTVRSANSSSRLRHGFSLKVDEPRLQVAGDMPHNHRDRVVVWRRAAQFVVGELREGTFPKLLIAPVFGGDRFNQIASHCHPQSGVCELNIRYCHLGGC